jgi:uncharacterized membrane protein
VKIANRSISYAADTEESDVIVMIQEMMIDVGLIENYMRRNMSGEGGTGKGVQTRIPCAILPSILLNIQGATTAFIQRLVNAMVIMVIQGSLTTHL